MELSLIIACYNEAETIEDTLPRVKNFLDSMGISYELIIIDDVSKDDTVALLKKTIQGWSHCTLLEHKSNAGRGGVIKEGIRMAKGKYVGFLDIDLEVPEYYILPAMNLLKNADVVIANRLYKMKFSTIIRWITGNGYVVLMRLFLHLRFEDTEAGFKFFDREKILPLLKLTENDHWFWDTEVVAISHFNNLKIKEIPVVFTRRDDKTSTVKLFSDSLKQFKALIGFRKKLKELNYL